MHNIKKANRKQIYMQGKIKVSIKNLYPCQSAVYDLTQIKEIVLTHFDHMHCLLIKQNRVKNLLNYVF